jgi:hypothetical protein
MREHKASAEHARINHARPSHADLGDETALSAQRAGLSPEQIRGGWGKSYQTVCVVGEKHTSQYLRRGESMSAPGAIVCRTLQEAIDALQRIGIST